MFTRGLSQGINGGDMGSDAYSSSSYRRQLRLISAPFDFGRDGYFLLNRESDRTYSSRMRALKNEWCRYEIKERRARNYTLESWVVTLR